MELIDNFNGSNWTKGDPNETKGFVRYRIGKLMGPDGPQQFSYAIFDDRTGDLNKVHLYGSRGKKDPLNGIGNLELKLSEDGKTITGIIVEDECVLYTS